MSSCTVCVYDGYPASYNATRQTVALGMFVSAVIVVVGGLCLFWSRRHSRLLSKRDNWSTILAALCLIISCQMAYREYFSEAAMPCALKAVFDYLQGALIPSVLVCRCVGLYARHLRQQAILQSAVPNTSPASSSASNVSTLDAMPSSVTPKPTPDRCTVQVPLEQQQSLKRRGAGPWHVPFDLVLLRLRLDTPAQLQRVVGWWLLPWVVYYVIRLGISPEYRSAAVGCRLDSIDTVICVLGGLIAAVAIFIILLRLWTRPDALFLRCEVAIQLGSWVVLLVWFAYGTADPAFDMGVINSAYAIHLGNIVTFLSSVWLPAILSFADESSSAPPSLVAQLGRYTSAHTGPTNDMALSCISYTSPALGGGDALVMESAAGTASVRGVSVVDENGTDSVGSQLTQVRATSRAYVETTLGMPITSCDSVTAVLAALAALPHLFEPAPTEAELVAILQQPAQKTLCDARALRLFAGTLLVCESGRLILYRALKREFSAEMLGFMLACAEIRQAARRVIPEAALFSALTQGRYRRHALPSVCHSQVPAGAVLAAVPLASPDATALAALSTDTEASTPDTLLSIADVFTTLSFLKNQFVAEGAPHQINISAAQVHALDAATAELVTVVRASGAVAGRFEAACASALREVCGAEREVLRLIVSGPVYRLVRSPAAFGMAVAALAAELRVDPASVTFTTSPYHDESGPTSATPKDCHPNPSPGCMPGALPLTIDEPSMS